MSLWHEKILDYIFLGNKRFALTFLKQEDIQTKTTKRKKSSDVIKYYISLSFIVFTINQMNQTKDHGQEKQINAIKKKQTQQINLQMNNYKLCKYKVKFMSRK